MGLELIHCSYSNNNTEKLVFLWIQSPEQEKHIFLSHCSMPDPWTGLGTLCQQGGHCATWAHTHCMKKAAFIILILNGRNHWKSSQTRHSHGTRMVLVMIQTRGGPWLIWQREKRLTPQPVLSFFVSNCQFHWGTHTMSFIAVVRSRIWFFLFFLQPASWILPRVKLIPSYTALHTPVSSHLHPYYPSFSSYIWPCPLNNWRT